METFHTETLATLNSKITISTLLVNDIIVWYHKNLQHPGVIRTYKTSSSHFCYTILEKYVDLYIKKCFIYVKTKKLTRNYDHLPPTKNVYDPWECVHIDLISSWIFTDSTEATFSLKAVTLRWPKIKESDSKTIHNVSNIFDNESLCRYPRPHYVIFDSDTEFGSNFRELLESYSIVPKQTTIKNPHANVYIERTHHVIANDVRALDLEFKPFDPSKVHGIFQSIA